MAPYSAPATTLPPPRTPQQELRQRWFRKISTLPSRLIALHERDAAWRELGQEPLEVAIIGGGITGAGIAYELAAQGRKVGLFDAKDFASGTSSRSSKLIHGGFRYLAQLEFGLVRKTALERAQIRKIAPHLTVPRWMVIPLQRTGDYAFYLSAVRTYEALGNLRPDDRASHALRGQRLLDREPIIDRDRFRYAVAFREYQTDDARLVLANLRACRERGGLPFNHTRVIGLSRDANREFRIQLRCELSSQEFEIRAKHVVNAAGPWVEELLRFEHPGAPSLLHLSKGIHIALSAERVPIRDGVVLRGRDRRYLFALRRGPIVYVGPTDTSFGKDAKWWPEIHQNDVDYLLEALNSTLNIPPLGHRDVIGAWAGLRPLIADPKKRSSSELSRKDELHIGPSGMISVAGGKLSGYRDMARKVLLALHRDGLNVQTKIQPTLPLPGAAQDSERIESQLLHASRSGDGPADQQPLLDAHDRQRLLQLYGSDATHLAHHGQRIDAQTRALDLEVEWGVWVEGASKLEDLVYRRLRLPVYEVEASPSWTGIAQRMATMLSWSPARLQQELAGLRQRREQELLFQKADDDAQQP